MRAAPLQRRPGAARAAPACSPAAPIHATPTASPVIPASSDRRAPCCARRAARRSTRARSRAPRTTSPTDAGIIRDRRRARACDLSRLWRSRRLLPERSRRVLLRLVRDGPALSLRAWPRLHAAIRRPAAPVRPDAAPVSASTRRRGPVICRRRRDWQARRRRRLGPPCGDGGAARVRHVVHAMRAAYLTKACDPGSRRVGARLRRRRDLLERRRATRASRRAPGAAPVQDQPWSSPAPSLRRAPDAARDRPTRRVYRRRDPVQDRRRRRSIGASIQRPVRMRSRYRTPTPRRCHRRVGLYLARGFRLMPSGSACGDG